MSKPIDLLIKEAARKQLPTAFQTDLTKHDRRAIQELGDNPRFLWCLREAGTHLLAFGTDGTDKSFKACSVSVRACQGPAPRHWYLYENNELKPITYEVALGLVK